jgi:hypothetical protein
MSKFSAMSARNMLAAKPAPPEWRPSMNPSFVLAKALAMGWRLCAADRRPKPVVVRFRPTQSIYTFARFTTDPDVAEFGPVFAFRRSTCTAVRRER